MNRRPQSTKHSGVLRATVERSGVSHTDVGDVCVGNVQMAGSYAGPGRMAMFEAGFPETVPMYAVNVSPKVPSP